MQSKVEIPEGSGLSKGAILSPEGLEEQVIREDTFRVTLTQGGKYRVYHLMKTEDGKDFERGISVHSTLEKAECAIANGMVIQGALIIDPKKTIEELLRSRR